MFLKRFARSLACSCSIVISYCKFPHNRQEMLEQHTKDTQETERLTAEVCYFDLDFLCLKESNNHFLTFFSVLFFFFFSPLDFC